MEFPKEGPQTDAERIKQRIGYTEADRVIDSSNFPEGMLDKKVFNFTIGPDCPSLSFGLMKQLFDKNSWRQLNKEQQRFINQIVLMVDKAFAGKRDVDNANQGDDWTFHLPKSGQATFSFYPRKGKGISINAAPLEYFEDKDEEKRFQEASRELLKMNALGTSMSLTDALKQLHQKVSYKDRVRLLRDEGKVWTAERIETVGGYTEVIDAINEEMTNFLHLPGVPEEQKQELFNAWNSQKLDRTGGPKSNLNYTGTGFQNLAWLVTIRRLMGNPPTNKEVKDSLRGIGFLGGYETVDPADGLVFTQKSERTMDFDETKMDWDEIFPEDTGSDWDDIFPED